MIIPKSVEDRFGDILLDRGAALATPNPQSKFGTHICQDYGLFLQRIGNGTVNPDQYGWNFWGDDQIDTLKNISSEREINLPDEFNAETYIVFAEREQDRRYFLFRTQRPKADTYLIYLIQRKDLTPYARSFEDFVQQFQSSTN